MISNERNSGKGKKGKNRHSLTQTTRFTLSPSPQIMPSMLQIHNLISRQVICAEETQS